MRTLLNGKNKSCFYYRALNLCSYTSLAGVIVAQQACCFACIDVIGSCVCRPLCVLLGCGVCRSTRLLLFTHVDFLVSVEDTHAHYTLDCVGALVYADGCRACLPCSTI
jgi:hypothetical protein